MFKFSRICNQLIAKNFCFNQCLCSLSSSTNKNVDKFRDAIRNGPQLDQFIMSSQLDSIKEPFVAKRDTNTPYIDQKDLNGNGRKVHIRTYGCQMNVNDTQITSTVLQDSGYDIVDNINDAEIVFLMTCAIRENAELKIWDKLKELSSLKSRGKIKKFGLLGCMAERLKTKLLEKNKSVDIIAGPDSYRDLPKLLAINQITGQSAVNVLLSLDETYSDIMPTTTTSATSAFVSIMRGCDNMCSYCIVPFTRGRERSRSIESIVDEVKQLSTLGIKEVTLLGQNVNSYRDLSQESKSSISLVPGFKTVYKPKSGGLTFDILLEEVAKVDPEMRIRFTSPHPKDFPDQVLNVIKSYPNIAKCIHLPAQSGSNQVLERMRRGYTREAYFNLVDRIRQVIPDCALSSDFICGFCGETPEEHEQTIDLLKRVRYNSAFVFAYSMRERTHAYYKLSDDVPNQIKIARLEEASLLYRGIALDINKSLIGKEQLILIEGQSKRSKDELFGRNEANLKVIVSKALLPLNKHSNDLKFISPGDYVAVQIEDCSAITLKAKPVYRTTLSDYYGRT